MSTEKPMFTRQEIATMLDVTCDQVRKSEKLWGIKGARCDLSRRSIRYKAAIVLRIFRLKGWL